MLKNRIGAYIVQVQSELWLKDMHPCSVFVKVHIRDKGSLRSRLMMVKTKNQMTLITKIYRLKIAQKNLNMNLNIRVMIHRI